MNEYVKELHTKWINVKDKAPPAGLENKLLFINGKKEVTYGYAYDWDKESEDYIWINDMDRETNEIATHWMKLPEKPND